MTMVAQKTPANRKDTRRKAGFLLSLPIWLAATAIIFFAQLDREARFRPGLAEYVPSAFRSFSQTVIVERLLREDGDLRKTYMEASKLLARRPMPSENLKLYALSAARVGMDDRSLQALGMAAARGWHDEVSQYAALDAAAQAGDWPDASLRLQALMQIQSHPAILGRAIESFMSDPHGRAVLATWIANNPPFQYRALSLAGDYGGDGAFPLLVQTLKPLRARMDCGSLRVLVTRWLARGDAGLALDAWTGLCARNGAGRENDLTFSHHEEGSDPFVWHISDQPMISWSLDPASGSLSYRHDESLGRLLAWRILTLPPGLHRLKMEGRPTAANGNYPLLRLRCSPSGRVVRMEPSSDDHRIFAALVPEDCNVQKLEVRVLRGSFLNFRITYP